MIVTLISNMKIDSITLPQKVSGQYYISNPCDNDDRKSIIIEAIEGEWVLKSSKNVSIISEYDIGIKNQILKPLNIYCLKINNEKIYIFAEPVTQDRKVYNKLLINQDANISIGRNIDNDISINNEFVSSSHAVLSYINGRWSVSDKNSTNGTFVNQLRIKIKDLEIGDVIYIMGLKIIIGSCFIAYNNPDGVVSVNFNVFHKFVVQESNVDCEEKLKLEAQRCFYPSPRFKKDIVRKEINIDSPPQNAIGDEMPLMLVIGPSMTMGMASLSTALFAVNNAMTTGNYSSAMPSIVMSFSMLLGTVMWPIITKKYEKKRRYKKENVRQKKYRAYLKKIQVRINEECERQEEILRENYISIDKCVDRIINVKRNLWERSFGHNDFLKLRCGLGEGTLDAKISYSQKQFSIDDDNLQEELYSLCNNIPQLKDIPITLSLFDDYISGVIGDRKVVKEFAKGLIFQIAALYSYDEVKMVFLFDEDEEVDFIFTKWLPHVWSDDKK